MERLFENLGSWTPSWVFACSDKTQSFMKDGGQQKCLENALTSSSFRGEAHIIKKHLRNQTRFEVQICFQKCHGSRYVFGYLRSVFTYLKMLFDNVMLGKIKNSVISQLDLCLGEFVRSLELVRSLFSRISFLINKIQVTFKINHLCKRRSSHRDHTDFKIF